MTSDSQKYVDKEKVIIYINGVQSEFYNFEGTEIKNYSKESSYIAPDILSDFFTTKDAKRVMNLINGISNSTIKKEVSDTILAFLDSLVWTWPPGIELLSLMMKKGMLKENPYKNAVNDIKIVL